MKKNQKAFTLIELLVVIAIIAILAAILFPVFAQAKAAAKKSVTLSNIKQIGTAAYMYANDYDDSLGDVPVFNEETETDVLAVRLYPYTKNYAIWRNAQSPYSVGAVQHGAVDFLEGLGDLVYLKAPDDPCVGVGKSVFPHGGSYAYIDGTSNTESNYYSDIFPPVDFILNGNMWGYAENGCPPGGLTGGFSHPGPNLTAGVQDGGGTAGGQNGTGDAPPSFTSVAKAVMMLDAPDDNQWWRGGASNALAAQFWGTNYQGLDGQGANAVFFDTHAKFYNHSALEPAGWDDADDDWKCANCSNFQYESAVDKAIAGQAWIFWGTDYADAAHQ